jgi:hypothetical protein
METKRLRQDLQNNGYSRDFVVAAIKSRVGANPKTTQEEKPLCYIHIPYIKGISEKFRRIGNQYKVKTIFKTRNSLRSLLTKTKPYQDSNLTAQCVQSIPCECGRKYIGQTGRPLAVRVREHKAKFKVRLFRKIKTSKTCF